MSLRNRFTVVFAVFAVLVSAAVGLVLWILASRDLGDEVDRKLVAITQVAKEGIRQSINLPILASLEEGEEETNVWVDDQRKLCELVLGRGCEQESPTAASPGRATDLGPADRADLFRWEPETGETEALLSTESPATVPIGFRLSRFEDDNFVNQEELSDKGLTITGHFDGVDGRWYKYGIAHVEDDLFLAVLIRADFREPLDELRNYLILLSVAVALLAGLTGRWVAGRISARLETLSRAALRIQRGWMDDPISTVGEDDIGRLARAMERMRSGIKRRDEQLRLMLFRVAHEIRNPLGGLELFAAAAQDTEDPKERQEVLARIRKEVLGLNEIINEFLGFARPAQSEPRLHDVRQPIEEAVGLVEPEVERKGGQLHVNLPRDPLLAIADPGQLKRLVLNLLRNGTQAGTSVWVDGGMLNGEVRISVRDDGPGIPKEIEDRIFEPFVSDKEQGAGLGLAIVKGIADANRGRIELGKRAERNTNARNTGGSGDGAEFLVYLCGPEDPPGTDDGSAESETSAPESSTTHPSSGEAKR